MMPSFASTSQLQFPLVNNHVHFIKINRRYSHTHNAQRCTVVTCAKSSMPLSTAASINEQPLDFGKRTSQLQLEPSPEIIRELSIKKINEILHTIQQKGGNRSISRFNRSLLGLISENESDIAHELYSNLSSLGLEPDVATFTILIDSLCKKGKLQRAFGIFEEMGRIGCKPTIYTYNCLLKGLCYVGRVEEAFEMLMDIKEKPLVYLDIYSYTIVMDGLCKVGRTNEAIELLNEAIEVKLNPNVVTYNTLFNGYCKEGKPMKGFRVLKLMKERNCIPDYITYNTFFNGLVKWGKVIEACCVYEQMEELGYDVNDKMMNTFIRGLCRKAMKEKGVVDNSAYKVFDKMLKSEEVHVLEPCTYSLIIRAFSIGEKIDEGLGNLKRMIKLGFIPRTITFNNLIQGLCLEGRVDEGLLVLVLMFDMGKIASRTSFDKLVNLLNRKGCLFGACSVYGIALKQGVIPHRKPRY